MLRTQRWLRRPRRRDLEWLLVTASAAALLALGGPGVEARAGAGARSSSAEIGGSSQSCRVSDANAERHTTAEAMEQLQARLAAEADASSGDVVVLNGRGYNYDRDRRVDPARELQILRRDEAAQAARGDTPAR